MDYSRRFKIALIELGLTKKSVAEKLGVSITYLNFVLNTMGNNAPHMLPNSDKSKEIQEAVKGIVNESNKITADL